MFGAILGDIIGSPYEHNENNIKTTDFPLFSSRSRYTDDTVMTVAVAEALMQSYGHNRQDTKDALIRTMQRLGQAHPDAGYGGRFFCWLFSSDPQPYHSFGNGSAMRVSPVGWLYDTLEETTDMAALTAQVSHNHPEGIKGAQAVAAAVFLARTGSDKEAISSYICRSFGYRLDLPLSRIRPLYRMDVSCQGSVPQAIRAFVESSDYESAVRLAVSIGGDSDTIAAMAGSIAEACYGIPPELETQGMEILNRQEPAFALCIRRFREFCVQRQQNI